MLVDAGRLDRVVVKDWKKNPANVPLHPTIPEEGHHAPPFPEPYHATMPHRPEHNLPGVGFLHYNMFDPALHYPPPHPPHPPGGPYPGTLMHGHPPPGVDPQQLMMPHVQYHTDNTNEHVQH